VDAWAVRLPAAVAAWVTVLLLYLLGRVQGRPIAGFVAAVVLATCLHFTWLARVGRIDMPLTLSVTVALAGFYVGQQRRRDASDRGSWRWFLMSYLAVAVGVMLKGPIAVVLPGLVVLGSLSLERPRCAWRQLLHELGVWWGVPLVLAVAAPWFVWANVRTDGELFRVFFWYHNVQRGLGGSEVLQTHPWWFYFPRLAFDLLPWSVLLPLAAWQLGRRGLWATDPLARFGAIWLSAVFVLLSLMRFKRADYLLPAYPGAALLLGCAAEHWWRESRAGRMAVAGFTLMVAGHVVGWTIYLERVVPGEDGARAYSRFAAAIRRYTPQVVVFFRAEAHNVAFHVAPPLTSLLEWENLDWWVGRPDSYYIVMPADCAAEWRQHLTRGRLEEVLRTTDLGAGRGERPLVLLRTHRAPVQ
jgi:4-amino-4-deoxy-L-arabinose transferase-like glycosyltransferase